jgi:hypothetical protein
VESEKAHSAVIALTNGCDLQTRGAAKIGGIAKAASPHPRRAHGPPLALTEGEKGIERVACLPTFQFQL